MFQRKLNLLFSGMPKVFGIVYSILIAGFIEWGKDCDVTLERFSVCADREAKT